MAAETPQRKPAASLDDELVCDYLSDHLDFFQRHPDMLRTLHIPHASGDAVSLVERQVSVLRERSVDLRHRLKELTQTARENERLFDATRVLVLQLLEAETTAELFTTFGNAMRSQFKTEYAALIVYGDEAGDQRGRCRTARAETVHNKIGSLLKGGKACCGALRREEFEFLFPGAKCAGSAALVPLGGETELGVVAVGSADANRYSGEVGTLFLQHIADVITRILPRLGDNG